jgi:hypothetical protein
MPEAQERYIFAVIPADWIGRDGRDGETKVSKVGQNEEQNNLCSVICSGGGILVWQGWIF